MLPEGCRVTLPRVCSYARGVVGLLIRTPAIKAHFEYVINVICLKIVINYDIASQMYDLWAG